MIVSHELSRFEALSLVMIAGSGDMYRGDLLMTTSISLEEVDKESWEYPVFSLQFRALDGSHVHILEKGENFNPHFRMVSNVGVTTAEEIIGFLPFGQSF